MVLAEHAVETMHIVERLGEGLRSIERDCLTLLKLRDWLGIARYLMLRTAECCR